MKDFLIDKIEELTFTSVSETESLWESGILDSITVVELATEVETEYGIEIPFDEIIVENFETLALLMQYIERKKASQHA